MWYNIQIHQMEKEFKKCNTEFQNPQSYERHGEWLLKCVLDFNTKKNSWCAQTICYIILKYIPPIHPIFPVFVDFCPPHSPNKGYFFESELPIFEMAYGGVITKFRTVGQNVDTSITETIILISTITEIRQVTFIIHFNENINI